MTLLERLYPNRCYDCLQPCPMDKVLCPSCEGIYAAERKRRAKDRGSHD